MEIEWKARSFVLLVLKWITGIQCKSRKNRNQNEGSVDSFNQVSAPISVEKYSSTKTQVRIGEIKGDFLHRGTFFISPESSSCARALSFSFLTFSLSLSLVAFPSFFLINIFLFPPSSLRSELYPCLLVELLNIWKTIMGSDACSCVLSHLTIDECIDSELTLIMIVDICCSTVEENREYSMRISWVFCTHRSARYRCRACFLEKLLLFPDRMTSEKSTNVARIDTEKTNWLCLSGQNKRVTDYVRIRKKTSINCIPEYTVLLYLFLVAPAEHQVIFVMVYTDMFVRLMPKNKRRRKKRGRQTPNTRRETNRRVRPSH